MSIQAHDERVRQLSPAKRALLEQWRRDGAAPTPAAAPIPRCDPGAPAPLSFAQQRLWFLDQLEPHNPFYNVAAVVRLAGPLNAAALEQALQASIERHDALRTTFQAIDGQAEQVVAPRIDWSLDFAQPRSADAEDREHELRELAAREALRPFDLVHGPLLRATLVRVAQGDHVLLLTMHHIACDGWSMGVLRQEIAERYAAIQEGRPARIDPLPIQYADFAAWQREQLDGPKLDRLLNYWSNQLADLPGPLELKLDFPRPAVQTYKGDVRRRGLDSGLTAELRRLASEEDATLFMVLLAAFQVLLARYSGQRNVCVGTPIANRNRRELEPLVGFFANTLVLRAALSANPTFGEFLAQVRRTTLDAYAHQDLPFERLVDHLRPPRDVSRTPIFQVMFVLQNIPLRARELAGLTITDVSFDHAPISTFDLTLNVNEQPRRLDLSLVFNPDLFQPATIERLLESYETLLREIVADRRQRVLEVSVLSAIQRQRQLVQWNDADCHCPDDRCVDELFADQARRTPDAPAVLCESECLTYRQLDQRSDYLARCLARQGVGPDVPVGLCVDRSPELVVGLLGILKAGGAYLPLDPFYPQSRLDYMIRDAGLGLILTISQLANRLPAHDCRVVLVDALPSAVDNENAPPLNARAAPDHLAYVIYTSGSTGEPKGVEVEHRGLVNHAQEVARRLELGQGDRLLQYLSLSFDAAAEEIFPTLVSGAALHLHPSPSELSGRALLDWSRASSVNVLHVPPPVWLSLLEELSAHGADAARHLKAVVTGGDSVRREDAARWLQVTGRRAKFLFAYGVTEATITSTLYEGDGPLANTASGRLPIGRPIANTRVYVLDEFTRPVPTGAAGELYIGGAGVARGYRGRSALTSERFVADPFTQRPNQRMYRTGDLVRYLHDGNLEFLGRLDHQVKIQGYRIEMGEIEAALRQHAAVGESVVVARPDASGEGRLAAYVGCGDAAAPTDSELRSFLAERLPRHMLPSAVTVLHKLPRLPCGKFDLQSLPSPCWSRPLPDRDYVAPSGDVQAKLAEIWAGVLGLDRVGAGDNFFELGGDSIRGIQLIARAGAAGIRFTPKQLFQHQTIAELSRVVDTAAGMLVDQGPVIGPARLSPIQHQFFALDLADPRHFNQSVLLTLQPGMTEEIVDAAARHLLTHHDALRMRYTRSPDGAWQQTGTAPGNDRIVEHADLSALPDAEIAAAIEQESTKAQTGFSLDSGRLVRVTYFDLGPRRPARLLIVIHHLVVDAVSWRILLEDLGALCGQIRRGVPVRLPPKSNSFAQWTERLASLADSPTVRGEIGYWTQAAQSTTSMTPLPCDHRQGENTVASSDAVRVSLDVDATRQWLVDSQAAYHTRPHELLVTALAETLCNHVDGGAVSIDLEGHGREDLFDDMDLSRTVGWFTALYPLALRRPDSARPSDWIKSIKEQVRSVPRGGIGYGVLRWLAGDTEIRDRLATMPRPAVSFNYLGQFDEALPAEAPFTLAAEATGPDRGAGNLRPHVLEIIAHVHGGRLHFAWHYSKNLHRRETVERWADQQLAALRRLIEHCLSPEAGGATPSDFPLAGIDQDDCDRLAELLEESDRGLGGAP